MKRGSKTWAGEQGKQLLQQMQVTHESDLNREDGSERMRHGWRTECFRLCSAFTYRQG